MKQQWILVLGLLGVLVACPSPNPAVVFTVTANSGTNGTVAPGSQKVNSGATATITVTANNGFTISSVTGCNGTLVGNTYTTGAITANCTVDANFSAVAVTQFTVTANAGANGTVSPPTQKVNSGATAMVTVTANNGFGISSVTGCGGNLNGNTYTTATVNADCTVNATFVANPPAATTGTTDFAVTGAGVLQASRTSKYRVSGLAAPVNGRPLIIFLHGNGTNDVQIPSAYATYTDPQAAVLVAPQGLNANWRFRMDGKGDDGAAAEVDDIAFIKEIITRGTNAANPLFGAGNKIDPSKVFIVGESRGAGFAYYLYAHPDTKNLITAIAPISGTFYCATSNGGDGKTPYNPPADSDFTCGENGGFGYFTPKASLYTRASPPRIFNIHGSDDFAVTPAPDLNNEYGKLIIVTKQWAITSDNCGTSLPSANPVFNASINGKSVTAYKQRNAANNAPCAADVTFFIVQGGGHVPQGYAERITKWFFGQYNTQTNLFN